MQKFIDNVPINLLVFLFQNTEENERNVELVVTLLLNHKGCRIVTIDFLPKDNYAEDWIYYFYKFVKKFTLDVEMNIFKSGNDNNVVIVCNVENCSNGKCKFDLPKFLGELVWSCLKENGMFQRKEKRTYDLMVPRGHTELKGFRILLHDPGKKAKKDILGGLRTAIVPIKSKINWGYNDHVI